MPEFSIKIPQADIDRWHEMKKAWDLDVSMSEYVRADPMYQQLVIGGKNGDLSVWFIRDWVIHRRHITQVDWENNTDTLDYNELMRRGYGLQEKFAFSDSAFSAYLHIRFDQQYSYTVRRQYEEIPI